MSILSSSLLACCNMGILRELFAIVLCQCVSARICFNGTSGELSFFRVKQSARSDTFVICTQHFFGPGKFCDPLQFQPQCSSCVLQLAVMFMRSYAFSGRKQKVLSILSLSFAFLVFSDIYLIIPALPMPKVAQDLPSITTGCFPAYGSTTFGLRIEVSTSLVHDFSWVSQWPTYLIILLSLQ